MVTIKLLVVLVLAEFIISILINDLTYPINAILDLLDPALPLTTKYK